MKRKTMTSRVLMLLENQAKTNNFKNSSVAAFRNAIKLLRKKLISKRIIFMKISIMSNCNIPIRADKVIVFLMEWAVMGIYLLN